MESIVFDLPGVGRESFADGIKNEVEQVELTEISSEPLNNYITEFRDELHSEISCIMAIQWD